MEYMRIMTVALALLLGIISVSTIDVTAQTNQATNSSPTADSTSGNITTQIMPQGTSVQEANQTSTEKNNTTSTVGRAGIDNNIGNVNGNNE